MSDEDKDNINKEGDVKVDENQPVDENKPTEPKTVESSGSTDENKEQSQSEGESSTKINEKPESSTETGQEVAKSSEDKKEHEVIHKKDGRLHIYIRQDKYKGELKSKNWVGRLYIDGKQKISSSGTPDLEEAIPKLEKWFEDVHDEKLKEQQNLEEASTSDQTAEELTQSTTLEQTTSTTENISDTPESKLETSTEEELSLIHI